METKVCTKCSKCRPLSEFYKSSYPTKDGLRPQCKTCHKAYDSQVNPEKRKQNSARYYAKRKQTDPALFMWKQAKHRAKYDYNDMEFSIEVGDIILPKVCPYLGVGFIPLDKEFGYSLDRIDSSKGYIKDNIRVISYKANRMKSDATEQELISFAKGVLAVHQGGSGTC